MAKPTYSPDRSTTVHLRMYAELRDSMKALGTEHGRSMNEEIVYALEQYVTAHRTPGRTAEDRLATLERKVAEMERRTLQSSS